MIFSIDFVFVLHRCFSNPRWEWKLMIFIWPLSVPRCSRTTLSSWLKNTSRRRSRLRMVARLWLHSILERHHSIQPTISKLPFHVSPSCRTPFAWVTWPWRAAATKRILRMLVWSRAFQSSTRFWKRRSLQNASGIFSGIVSRTKIPLIMSVGEYSAHRMLKI